jgi:muramoyltetrapeptide carboxypeptidase
MPVEPFRAVHPLGTGARVALVTPAGPLRGEEELEQARSNVRAFGWEPIDGRHVLARAGYLAGTDAQRLDDLNRALCDDRIDAVWCVRGGYGVTRLLDGVAYDALRRRAKPVIGYSDITALHAAIGRECDLITYHAPTARAVFTPFTRTSFERAVVTCTDSCGESLDSLMIRGGVARGRLMGGNLALLSALCGTRYMPDLSGAILVLEDVNEAVYRVDRMLQQLLSAGTLGAIAGIAFGHCTACDSGPEDPEDERTLPVVLGELAERLGVPCVLNIPVGHIDDQWSIPLGAMGVLDADAGRLLVERVG